jgi:hypothetical protein
VKQAKKILKQKLNLKKTRKNPGRETGEENSEAKPKKKLAKIQVAKPKKGSALKPKEIKRNMKSSVPEI